MTGWSLLDRVGQDLRHALRRLRGQPSTAVLAVALLALAIGMSSAMFTVVDALILRPAPFRDPASFVWLGVGESEKRFNANLPLGLINNAAPRSLSASTNAISTSVCRASTSCRASGRTRTPPHVVQC